MDPAVLVVIGNLALAVAVLAQMLLPMIKHNAKGNPNGRVSDAVMLVKLDGLQKSVEESAKRLEAAIKDSHEKLDARLHKQGNTLTVIAGYMDKENR